ncbi:hypothetical protein MMC27_006808 [Xylographa pallens]|nr:hypothetical protein [Xylographa pallens]
MALTKIPPMTSRQAKKAYRQASGPRVSPAEQKRMERKAVLLEREEKAKEKEKNKIANKRKRMEKEEKAKAQRKCTGIVEEGYVSPRQVRLAAYFVRIGEQDGDEDCRKQEESPLKDRDLPRLCFEESVAGGEAHDLALAAPTYQSPQELNFSDNDWASFLPTNTQVERELSEGNPVAQTFAAIDDADSLRPSHSEHCGLQKAIASTCELQSNASLQQEELAQIPPFSTQDLEFSADELTELMSPAKFPEAIPSLKGTSAGQFNLLTRANQLADPAPHSGPISNGKDGTSMQKLAKEPATPHYSRVSSRPSQHTIFKQAAITSKPPEIKNRIPRPCTHPQVTESSRRKTYVLADREVVPGHAKYVLHRLPPPASTKTLPKTVFGHPIPNAMRPPPRKPLGASKGNTTRVAWTKLAVTSAKDESKHPTPQPGEHRRPSSLETASTGFDFGDSFLSTQELLDYVV